MGKGKARRMGDWTGFFAAEVGAAAALAGLVMVAISINLSRILDDPMLPGRAVETLVLPTGALVASSFALVPGQPPLVFALETALTGAAMWLVPVLLQSGVRGAQGRGRDLRNFLPRVLLAQLSSVPIVVSGVLIYLGSEAALYWMVAGIVTSLIATVINAWVLLVEILR
ncbi:MAG: hypothetical protein WDN01_07735 [Rhizomicrobium sp.]